MAREYSEETILRVSLNAIEDDTPSVQLTLYMTDYSIPARVVAGVLGISVPTLYQHLNADEAVRLTRHVEPKVLKLLERLKTLAVEGKLNVLGSTAERNAELLELLTIEEAEQ